ncbi:flavodoxin [Oceanobacillus sp. 143]|uniref:Flavodoxin n=1 Tax=Oceanobacillus zhaokaii TaxID=2052660 RepID=A0A345PJ83_9BACI|nr:flavodoxin domain-containing protein [Oceanobacillus zhaokaii]AXI10063.1 flavodoxin [Oceanobacillus zhaokaii]QGS69203.1 flavodoxin [Oceanobacillus sp. 143]
MSKILLLYASATGNTELMAKAMANHLRNNNNHDVVVKMFDYDEIEVKELENYDGILFGVYTWVGGDLPFEVEDFYDQLDGVNIKRKPFAVFGSADSFYDEFGTALDLMYERFEKLGAVMVPEKLVVDLEPSQEDIKKSEQLSEKLLRLISGSELDVK